MRKLVVGTFLTLDGVMQAPGGPDEDREGGFQHGGWLVPYFDEKFVEIMTEWTKRAGAFLLGLARRKLDGPKIKEALLAMRSRDPFPYSRDEIAATLEAASIDEDAAAQLRSA